QNNEPTEAIQYLKKAIKINPQSATSHFNMGNALQAKGSIRAAIENYAKALKIKPIYAEAHTNMGVALKENGDLTAAIKSHKESLKIDPNCAEAYYNLGNALHKTGDLNAAIKVYKKAVKILPDYAYAYKNMGISLHKSGDLDLAIVQYKRFLEIKPDDESARAYKLHQQAHTCDWAAIEEDRNLIPSLGTLTQKITPFAILAMEDDPRRHRLRSEVFTNATWPQASLQLGLKPLQKPKRLRIGYFSADFYNHATMYLMAKVFEAHDPERFEIYAYSFGLHCNGEMRQRIMKAVDVFVDVTMTSDEDIALLARQDEIDIAVDLKGFTEHSQFGIFVHRAAPIQISYLGYPGTSGAACMDYLIADKVVIPKHLEPAYSESIIHLPYSYQATDNARVISPLATTKLEVGLPEQGFVFCCFNSNYKISPTEFDIWMRLLAKVEGSVLWLLKSNKWAEHNLRSEAEYRGISGDRLVFANPAPNAEHLARHRLADLFIDTFNVNAHTTASDALWAGLPVVTKLGNGFAARVAGSLLTAIDL
ncbi:MAG: tetratricopeptide repeat protein, partial [Planktomarina sp.]|nr:tetratricopeptide repeat protein [Planktomarina sp.]